MRKAFRFLITLVVVMAAFVVVMRVLFPLPSNEGRENTAALPADHAGPLGIAVKNSTDLHHGKTGIEPLAQGADAFAARMVLAKAAKLSIDTQYYIWHDDLTGTLLLDELRKAAERGVRVRLLVDDNGTKHLDAEFAALNALPNMEVRVFNPFVIRSPKLLNYGFDFFRLNHRMHNKSFTVDNVATVIGGRNVGDEYFGTGEQALFVDLDVLAVGKIVPEISSDFDHYWASVSSYPVDRMVSKSSEGLEKLKKSVEKFSLDDQFSEYQAIVSNSKIYTKILDNTLSFEWTDATLISDDPIKAQGNASKDQLMLTKLFKHLGAPKDSLDLVSPYFVLGKSGTKTFSDFSNRGVKVRVLTNSFLATDVPAVHAGYTKQRDDLLKAGVKLFELKPSSSPVEGKSELNVFGSSGASLHAKTLAIDGDKIFVGSFNFDPRSALLNTEMGLLFTSPELGQKMTDIFDNQLVKVSYRPELQDGNLVWNDETTSGDAKLQNAEPGTTVFSRIFITVLGWLPIEWLL